VPFFSGAVTLSSAIDDVRRVAICGPREICMVLDRTRTEHGKCVACLLGFPCKAYIDSNRRDSRI
jgi:hypothetical protein